MSQQNVEVVRGFNAAVNRGDRKTAGAMVHPEVEWRTMAGPILGIEAVSGRDQVIRIGFEQIPEGIEEFRVTLGEEERDLILGQRGADEPKGRRWRGPD